VREVLSTKEGGNVDLRESKRKIIGILRSTQRKKKWAFSRILGSFGSEARTVSCPGVREGITMN